jgi:hypothetical protein
MRMVYLFVVMLLVGACSEERSTVPEPPDDPDLWVPIGSELPAPVTSLCASDSGLIAATSAGIQSPTDAILWRWRDSSWVQVAPPLTGSISVMKWYQGALVRSVHKKLGAVERDFLASGRPSPGRSWHEFVPICQLHDHLAWSTGDRRILHRSYAWNCGHMGRPGLGESSELSCRLWSRCLERHLSRGRTRW